MSAWHWIKLWSDLPDKLSVRREVREHGTAVAWAASFGGARC